MIQSGDKKVMIRIDAPRVYESQLVTTITKDDVQRLGVAVDEDDIERNASDAMKGDAPTM